MSKHMKIVPGMKYQFIEPLELDLPFVVQVPGTKATRPTIADDVSVMQFAAITFEGENTHIKIQDGWAYDGPSGLTIDTKTSLVGAAVHDLLYQWLRVHAEDPVVSSQFAQWRRWADGQLYHWCVQSGMYRWRARLWYRAVRQFGKGAASAKSRREKSAIVLKINGGGT